MATANRGKVAETQFQNALKAFDGSHHNFDWARNYDAHSAGGKFASLTGDFVWYFDGDSGAVEVKEVAHDYRLPAKNFGPDQIARMFKRQLAGACAQVVVYHSTTKKWRLIPLDYFRARLGVPSWDLREIGEYGSAVEVLAALLDKGRRDQAKAA